MSEQSMSLEQFRQAKETGIDLYAQAEVQADAALNAEVVDETNAQDEAIVQESTETQETNENADLSDDTDDPIEIPEAQKTAFQKALERNTKKAREAAEKELKEQFEAEYSTKLNPYQKFFDQLGVTPEQALASIEQGKIKQEAENLAYQNGWSEEQTQMYVRQQELERNQTEMKVNLRVYELSDSPDYPGIKQMKGAITEFIRSNPRVSVEQAYWAVGGANLATQLKREAEQREIAKRSQSTRKVVSDAQSNNKGPAPLTADAVAFMRRTGMSETEVRMLMNDEGPKNLTEYRQMMKKKG